ncbi:MAG: DegT/DnrJ/EryC1/StrS family aminotransferase [Rhodothermales bacterium]
MDSELHEKIRMIANHGGRKKHHNEIVGVNSRLDSLQAAALRVRLRHLDAFMEARRTAAHGYDGLFAGMSEVVPPSSIRTWHCTNSRDDDPFMRENTRFDLCRRCL